MTATYRHLIYSPDGTSAFGVGNLLCEFENAKNTGYGRYINDVSEAFFTINQDDPKLTAAIRSAEGVAHHKILRNNEVVWRGLLGEHEATEADVVFYSYGYEAPLYWLQSDWNQTWSNKQIDVITTALVARFRTGITYSQLGFVTSGTIEAPVTTSGGATPISLPSYKAYYKRLLFALKELAAVAASDTTNTPYFELAYTNDPTDNAVTFNFWKNRSTDRTNLKWEFPNANIQGFVDRYAPILLRNDVFGVGSGAHNQLFRHEEATSAGALGYQTIGRRMEPVYLTWVRDQTDLNRVTKLRAAKALRADTDLILKMLPDSIPPIGATAAGYRLGDRIPVKIDQGITQIDKLMFLAGQQVISIRGSEKVYPFLSDRAGS